MEGHADIVELGKVRRPSDSCAIIDSRDGGIGDSDYTTTKGSKK
jgi:hypothetical protein